MAEVTPPEDLMREHGVLRRVLLIYEETLHRLDEPKSLPVDALASAADIVRRFIEGYHERSEEEYLFPRFEKAGLLVDLVAVLRRQHQAGRRLTAQVQALARAGALEDAAARRSLGEALRLFLRMYRPHAAREDTVLFPALRSIMSPAEFDALADELEDKEHELFGHHGFERIVAEVAKLEQAFGIHDLDRFTPPA